MISLKCLIIDDEPVARKIIREYIEETDFLELAGEAENALDTSIDPAGGDVDLIFLDVQMSGMSGIEFLDQIHPSALTIMTTAYPEYALRGYELDVLDYLVKPISFERFLKAAHKAFDFHTLKLKADTPTPDDTILIKCDRILERIFIRDIQYVEAMANYVIVHTEQKKYVTYLTFKGISEQLPSTLFVRIHKSYLIALAAITRVENNRAIIGNNVLPISKYYRRTAMTGIRQLTLKRA